MRSRFCSLLAASLLASLPAFAQSPRLVLNADSGWKFLLGNPSGAEAPAFSDKSWRSVQLPHDWSIESAPEKSNLSGSGGGHFPDGLAWYRKTFTAPAEWKGKCVSIEFDGVYRNVTVYLNGQKLGNQPYGYSSFSLDLTPQLHYAASNTLAVKVDNSAQPNSRWYSGAGIYRHVRVVVANPAHVAHWGVFVTTPEISASTAQVQIATTLSNDAKTTASLTLQTSILDSTGAVAGTAEAPAHLDAAHDTELKQSIAVANPRLWSPETPVLYRAVTRIIDNGVTVDEVVTPFGIRSLTWSATNGIQLNGKSIKLTGGSVHHDNGPLGAAAFDRAEERRVELLKAAGHNAVRTAHNIPSPAFLDACDRLGLLVLDEPFDVWEAHKVKYDYASEFAENWDHDLSAMVLRDRNHPAIVIWGIGNEIPELEVEKGQAIAKKLVDRVHSLDTTRPLTLAFPGTTTSPTSQPVFALLDITGYNYSLQNSYADDHTKLPSRLMLTTESFPANAFRLWKISHDNPYVLGDLTWTALDYLGESGIGAWTYGTPEQAQLAGQISAGMMNTTTVDKMFAGMAKGVDMEALMKQGSSDPLMKSVGEILSHNFPWHAAMCGDIDLTGYRKPQSYYRDIIWNGGDRIYATVRLPEPDGKKIIAALWATYPTMPSWTWPGQEGKTMEVEVYSGVEKIQLYLNDKLIGEQATSADNEFKAVFPVPYTPGILKAVGLRGDQAVAESIIKTASPAAALRLTADRATIHADGEDLSFVTVEAVDANGQLQPQANQQVEFSINGPGAIAAVGNGDPQDPSAYQGTTRKLYQGRALIVVRSSNQPGAIEIRAKVAGLKNATAAIQSEPASLNAELK